MLPIINLLGIRKLTPICHFEKITDFAVMRPISEEDEKNIDKGLRYNTGKEYIDKDRIYMYGEIDFNNKKDIELIKNKKLLSPEIMSNFIYNTFDYVTGTATPIDNKYKFTIEINPINWFKYHHCLIGKPKRIIVYKVTKNYI